ncbi:electron transfer flavoprotein subunit beta/FixA family protein [bacterium]|nr:electron transfer flavoprotein subunit beta/FixA family protein [bacterium]
MKIAVLVKEVPNTESRPRIEGGRVSRDGIDYVVNPYDEYAVEEAITKAEALSGETFFVTVGGVSEKKVLLNVLAMGIDRAIVVNRTDMEGSNPRGAAKIIAKVLESEKPDLILAGKQGVDYDYGQTPLLVAEYLGLPHVSMAIKIDIEDGKAICERNTDDGVEVVEVSLPAVITADKGLNLPRYPKLKGIMGAKKKPWETKELSDLGLDESLANPAESQVEYVEFSTPPARQAGRIIDGEPADKVKELVRALSEDSKVF